VTFALGTSMLKVCEHCGVALVRKGADLASYGRVAEIIPTESKLVLGARGRYAGAPPFTLVGRLQLDYGEGTWDEWLMAFEGGSSAWLSEAQGHLYYLGEVAEPPLPPFSALRVGETIDLGPPGTFVVSEVRTAKFAAVQGELPFSLPPGSALHYADLSGPGGELGTIDYGSGSAAEALYVGREVTLEEMGLHEYARAADDAQQASARGLSCPQCGGPIELRVKGETKRVACPYCGSLLDADHGLKVLEALDQAPTQPRIPLGSQGRISGMVWTVVGFLIRSTEVEGIRYPWDEYLLHAEHHGFRWLVCAQGHWSFLEPVPQGAVRVSESAATYKGETYRHFQSSIAQVDEVLGEFYWAVSRGDVAETADFVNPPRVLSAERESRAEGEGELNCSEGAYMEAADVWKAFSVAGDPPRPTGIAPNQPNPLGKDLGLMWTAALFALAFVTLLYLGLAMTRGQQVFSEGVRLFPGQVSGAVDSALVTEPFEIQGSGNVQVTVRAPVSNSWIYFDGALINEDTSSMDEFELEVSYYFGSDSDGSWTEGDSKASTTIGSVPAGHYRLRLAPQWEAGKMPTSYSVTVRRGVPGIGYLVLAWIALLALPILAVFRRFAFEAYRWAESDHPMVHTE
jgi:hypothetical protein